MEGSLECEVRPLTADDLGDLPAPFAILSTYLQQQEFGQRSVLVAVDGNMLAGHVSVLWFADDPEFRHLQIPEISDLHVRSGLRRRGIGTALMERAEALAATRSPRVGLNVGLHSGYGAAQRIYVKRGYLPDGAGVVINGVPVAEGATICLDDDPIVTLRLTKQLAPRSF